MEHKDIAAKSLAIRQQLEAKLGVKSRDLSQALRRAGRRLPHGVRAQGAVLAEAEKRAGHPKLTRQLDSAAVRDAYDRMAAHLRAIDVADARKGRILGMAGVIAFNLLLIIAAFVMWLWWRGYV
ncbi:hypothetical protein [Sulfitobacter sp. MF3-043]|uniref:hypothetical protein n=1 Tax=Sulfitobacter sediminivivens TaxID=3252902 RepID=UPI0036DE6B4B